MTNPLPTNPWQIHTARVIRKLEETPGVATYDLELQNQELRQSYRYRPGQFNMIYIPGLGEAAISMSGDARLPEIIAHTIRQAGNVTNAVAQLSAGDSVGIRGPFGSWWPIEECAGQDIILVAGGIGLAPLRPVIHELLNRRDDFGRCSILMGARDPSGLLYEKQYSAWRSQSVDVYVTCDRPADGWSGNVGVVTALLDRLPVENPSRTVVMTCGPEVMMWYAAQTAIGRGISPNSVYVSLERNMNCAIGLCGHCQFGPNFLCKDGPVFRFDRVASILRISDL